MTNPLLIILTAILIFLNLSILLLFYALYLRRQTEKRKALVQDMTPIWDDRIEDWLLNDKLNNGSEAHPYEFLQYLMSSSEIFPHYDIKKLAALIRVMSLEEYLLKCIKGKNTLRKAWAIHIIGYFQIRSLKDELKVFLKHENTVINYAAHLAMVRLVNPAESDYFEILTSLIANFDSWTTEKLGEFIVLMGEDAGRELLRILKEDQPQGRLRWFLIDIVGEMEVKDAEQVLVGYLDKDRETVVHAIRSLGLIGNKEVLPQLISLLGHQEWIIRAQVAKVLGYFKDVTLNLVLAEALEDENWWVRHNAAQSIAATGDTGLSCLNEVACTNEKGVAQDMALFMLEKFEVRNA